MMLTERISVGGRHSHEVSGLLLLLEGDDRFIFFPILENAVLRSTLYLIPDKKNSDEKHVQLNN